MIYSTGSHTKFYHRFHVVWTTKYRYKVLRGPMRGRIREIIRQTCQVTGARIFLDHQRECHGRCDTSVSGITFQTGTYRHQPVVIQSALSKKANDGKVRRTVI